VLLEQRAELIVIGPDRLNASVDGSRGIAGSLDAAVHSSLQIEVPSALPPMVADGMDRPARSVEHFYRRAAAKGGMNVLPTDHNALPTLNALPAKVAARAALFVVDSMRRRTGCIFLNRGKKGA
jgi:hypothetical protein